MSLFGDLPEARTPAVKGAGNPATSSAVATAARLQPSIVRKAAAFAATPSVLRAGRVRGGIASSGGGHGASQDAEGDAASGSAPAAGPAPHSIFSGGSGAPIQDEYDPARPNNYEELRSARDEKQRQAEEAEKRQAQIRQLQQLAEQRAARIAEEAREEAEAYASSGIPPEQDPPYQEADGGPSGPDAEAATGAEARRQSFVSMSGEEAFRRRAALSGAAAGGAAGGRPDEGAGFSSGAGAGLGFSAAGASASDAGMPGSGKAVKGMSLAQKMLEKLGWRAGEGLGKNRQGMAEPLVAKKTDTRSGVIVNATAQVPAPRPDEQPAAKRPKTQGSVFQGAPSRVVLLKNLVGPGGVDEELEDEVAGELSKYGAVQKVRIFEVTEPGFPEDQAVRIFVQFDRVESTTKAVVELQGRFFGGRTVSADFYDEQLFERKDLAPQPHELP